MYIRLNFLLTKKEISLEYRRNILSFFKKSLSDSDEKYLNEFYGGIMPKDFTWYAKMSIDKIEDGFIKLKNNDFTIIFSTGNLRIGLLFWNAFLKQRNLPFKIQNDNYLVLNDVVQNEHGKITKNEIVCKTTSPLVLIKQNTPHDNKSNWFLSFEDSEFKDVFKQKTGLDIVPINCKKVIISHYNIKFPTTTGTFMLSGPRDLLNKYYCSGVGDKHSQGFGNFNIMQ